MDNPHKLSYTADLDFEVIKLPPVRDILVVAKKTLQGRHGILQSFELILPDVFELCEVNDGDFPQIDAIIVNKALLVKIPMSEILAILKAHVFPYVARGETIKVNFNLRIFRGSIKGEVVDESARVG